MPDGPHSAELAYWVRPEQRRRGIGLRSVEALTGWAHRGGGVARLWLEIDPGNTGSLKLARRAGYRLGQRLPRHCRAWLADDPDGDQWHDCLIFAHRRRSCPTIRALFTGVCPAIIRHGRGDATVRDSRPVAISS
jgi:RimJ/RimL family protein N-acetyltransferase